MYNRQVRREDADRARGRAAADAPRRPLIIISLSLLSLSLLLLSLLSLLFIIIRRARLLPRRRAGAVHPALQGPRRAGGAPLRELRLQPLEDRGLTYDNIKQYSIIVIIHSNTVTYDIFAYAITSVL